MSILEAQRREWKGSKAASLARARGEIPAVLYGGGGESVPLIVEAETLSRIVGSGGHVVDISLGGAIQKALLKASQIEPLSEEILHADFLRISETTRLTLAVRLVMKGTPVLGGVLEQPAKEIEVSCLPADIPAELVANVADLPIGGIIHLRDIALPERVTLSGDPATVAVVNSRPGEKPAAAAEPAEGEEPAEPEKIGKPAAEETEEEEG